VHTIARNTVLAHDHVDRDVPPRGTGVEVRTRSRVSEQGPRRSGLHVECEHRSGHATRLDSTRRTRGARTHEAGGVTLRPATLVHPLRASVPHAIALGVGHARTLQGLHCRRRTLYVARKLPSARRLKENSMATTISADTKPAGLIRELRTTFRDSAESSLRHTAASGSSGVTVSPGACVATPDSAESSMAGGGDSRVSCIAA
jgi:hypothetical protein